MNTPTSLFMYFSILVMKRKSRKINGKINKQKTTNRNKPMLRMTVVYHVLTTIYCFSQATVTTYVVNKNKMKMGIKRKDRKR